MSAPPRASDRALSAAAGQLAGWALLAGVNALVIMRTVPMPLRPHGVWLRGLHHLYDAGQILALGLLVWTGVALWRVGRERIALLRRGAWGHVAIAVVATAVAVPVLSTDLLGAASRLFGERHATIVLGVLLAASGAAVAVAAKVGSLCVRCGARFAGVLAGLAVGTVNHFVLRHDYPGVHFYVAWAAATAAGTSLAGLRLPFVSPTLLIPLLAAPAAVALGKVPPNMVQLELLRLPGSVAAPLIARTGMTPQHAAAAWQGAEPGPDIPASSPSLIPPDGIVRVLVVDALRADVINAGAHADRLPEMDAIRREGVELTRARSPASGTIWSLASIFSGRYYSQLYWTNATAGSGKVYPDRDPTVRFPEVLARAGIRSATVLEMGDVSNHSGVVRGITRERYLPGLISPAGKLVDVLLESLDASRDGPCFAYVHFLDAHAPYERITRSGTPFERYLGELAGVDRAIGRLRRALAERGLTGRTSIILSADHGEAFGEHDTWAHAVSVYDELLRVPLLIDVPGVAPRRVDREVTLMDLGPTVLDLMGQPTPGTNMGESLVPFLRGQDPVLRRPIVAETGRSQEAMIFPDGFKAIRDGSRATFEPLRSGARSGRAPRPVRQPDRERERLPGPARRLLLRPHPPAPRLHHAPPLVSAVRRGGRSRAPAPRRAGRQGSPRPDPAGAAPRPGGGRGSGGRAVAAPPPPPAGRPGRARARLAPAAERCG